ncbi:zinc-binding metallopeptidase family protein [Falsiroseomonas sp. HW251]|uniref:zinc-binding metallopeptidase family protein n=1 Tax=Falsiroseomonas sp. HW251 TaxID=3390998 RepID=UPI003D32039E
MRLFACQKCSNLLHFENTSCEKCGSALGYLPPQRMLSAFADGVALLDRQRWKPCANAAWQACNWMLREDEEQEYCPACRHNAVVPDLTIAANLPLWQNLEVAKHRLLYTLDRLDLPHDPEELRFSFLADTAAQNAMTGHDNGQITVALAEADDAEREKRRSAMHEPFRTLLGHFRHEVGHYYFLVLVERAGRQDAFRALFGDERADYAEALKAHYAKPPSDDWRGQYISAYAAAHPHEDWAECFAHYLHMVDSLEMAASFGMSIRPRLDREGVLEAEVDFDPYRASIEDILLAWTPLTVAMNAMNRSMGTPDLYPFVLSEAVGRKLGFIHELVHHRPRTRPN